MKIIAHVNGIPIDELVEEQRNDFEKYVIKCLEDRGYKLHKKKDKEHPVRYDG